MFSSDKEEMELCEVMDVLISKTTLKSFTMNTYIKIHIVHLK